MHGLQDVVTERAILGRATVCANAQEAMVHMKRAYRCPPREVAVSKGMRHLIVTLEDAEWLVEHGYEYEII
jgi:hypothetical protein